MTIKFAGGFLPYIYKLDPNAFEGTSQIGSQRSIFVTVKNEDIALLKHEEHHIKQFYFTLAMIAAFLWLGHLYFLPVGYVGALIFATLDFIPFTSFRKEATAYAVSVKYGRELESAVSALKNHSYAKGDADVARNAITGKKLLGLF